ncbi:MAG TPA: hypothetical protein VLX89_11150 [Actinomycetota bacterium]|nr:hypothetical protein [Actinomycetota bacterium]
MIVGFPLVVVIALILVVSFVWHRDRASRARFLRRAGFMLMALITFLFGAFIVGETFTDPGGWEAAALVALWAAPLIAGVLVAWYRPDLAVRIFSVLIAVVIGVSVWFAIDPQGWRSFEDHHGPIRAIVVFAMSAAIAALGLKRTRIAGWMLLVLGIIPILVSSIGGSLGFASLVVVSSPPVIAGALYVLSASMADHSAPPGHVEPGPDEHPLAA